MLRGGALDLAEQEEYERRMAEQGYLTPQQGMDQSVPINPLADIPASMPEAQRAQLAAERNYTMRRVGFIPDGKGGFVDPQRDIAGSAMVRLQMMQERDRQQTEAIANSKLFKAGDTLADAGRIFLSPLFWLKGQDQSQYDPSDRLKTGYNLRFNEMNALREANYQKFVDSRKQRLAAATTLENSRANQRIQMMSPFEKELQNFAARRGLQDMYRDPKQVEELAKMLRLQNGQAMKFGDTIIDEDLHKIVLGRAEKFETSTSSYRDAMMGFSSLRSALGSGNAVGNIAAVFTFMKTLDPNSVVREGEFQLAARAGGLYTKLMSMFDNVKTGEFIRPEVAKEMLEVAGQIAALYEGKYNEKRGRFAKEFKKYQYSDDDIKTLLGDEVRLDEGTATPPPPPPAPPEDVRVTDATDPAGAALAGYLEPEEVSEVPPNGK